jgi:hypothetical protein
MKKIVLGGLIVLSLIMGLMVIGCDTGDDETKDVPKVVAEKYRGTYEHYSSPGTLITLTENTFINSDHTLTAWTVDNQLWVISDENKQANDFFFKDDNSLYMVDFPNDITKSYKRRSE